MSRAVLKKFGLKIKKARLTKRLSQEKLAELSGLHPTYIGRVERGIQNVSLINIHKIVSALKVSISDIFPD